jgi:hypothetical protein
VKESASCYWNMFTDQCTTRMGEQTHPASPLPGGKTRLKEKLD